MNGKLHNFVAFLFEYKEILSTKIITRYFGYLRLSH